MTSIDFRIMAEAASGLDQQAQSAAAVRKQLSDLIEESMRAQAHGEGIGGISETGRERDPLKERSEPFLARLREAELSLEIERCSLERASEALQEILRIYNRAQERAADIMNGEVPVIPRTEFGTSYFGNLQACQSLIPVVRRIPVKDGRSGRTGSGQTEAGRSLPEPQKPSDLTEIL